MNGVEKMAKDLAAAKETMDAMLIKIGEQAKDIAFLLERSRGAWSFVLGGDRDCGASSNSIVYIAYGLIPIEEQVFPSDQADLDACRRMLDKLPIHRITKDVHEAMFRATQALAVKQREFAGRS
ncbi:MAG TPA: hypothetical protein PKI68_01085 [Pontiellaceae bacterium]|nr:hypothetical protein [Pontiellaceae bacterium]